MSQKNNNMKLISSSDCESVMEMQTQICNWQMNLQQAVFNGISAEDVSAIVKKQVEKAKAGDETAIRFIFGSVIGASRNVTVNNTQVITDVAGAARIAKRGEN